MRFNQKLGLWLAGFAVIALRVIVVDAPASSASAPVTSPAIPSLGPARELAVCLAASPGPGYRANGSKYVITPQAFDLNTNVREKIKSLYGETADLADWQTLKKVLSGKAELTQFIEHVGIPRQLINGPCDNFLVSNNGQLKLGDRFWLFLARHDGTVPNNWATVDSIGDHTLDLGRWSHKAQALVVIRENVGPSSPPVPPSPPTEIAPSIPTQVQTLPLPMQKLKLVEEGLEKFGLTVLIVAVIAIIFGLTYLPTIIAFTKRHPNRWVILGLNSSAIFAAATKRHMGSYKGMNKWYASLIWSLRKVHISNRRDGSDGGESGLNLFANDRRRIRHVNDRHEHPEFDDDFFKRLDQISHSIKHGEFSITDVMILKEKAAQEWLENKDYCWHLVQQGEMTKDEFEHIRYRLLNIDA
jgi:hypothetical protein